MSLLNSYGSHNYRLSRDLSIRYVTKFVNGKYLATRYATKSYAFVGMSRAAAVKCRDDKINQYTRIQRVATVQKDGRMRETFFNVLLADVDLRQTSGCTYSVVVSVNETDSRSSDSMPSDVVSFFALENERDYDDLTPRGKTDVDSLDGRKVTSSELTKSYSQSEHLADDGTLYYIVEQSVSKAYAYLDLSYAIAKTVYREKQLQYTRNYDDVVETDDGYSQKSLRGQTSDVYIASDSGNSFAVHVSVNETDRRISTTKIADFAAFFADLDGRNYDEE